MATSFMQRAFSSIHGVSMEGVNSGIRRLVALALEIPEGGARRRLGAWELHASSRARELVMAKNGDSDARLGG